MNKKVLITSLKAQKLISLDFKDGKVLSEETLIEGEGRLRDVEFNSKGEIFIIGSKSGIWKLPDSTLGSNNKDFALAIKFYVAQTALTFN